MVDIRHIIQERELLLYPHIPLGVFRNSGEWPEAQYQYSLFLYTNDQSNRITEWIAYHQQIGFSHFYIYSYHDDPSEFYQQLLPFLNASSPCVTYHHYAKPGNAHQTFCHFFRNYAHETKWFLWLDIDEFLCLKNTDTIHNFTEQPEYQDLDGLCFNLCHYGHSFFEAAPDGDILLHYTFRSSNISSLTRIMIQSKSVPYNKLYHEFSTEFKRNYFYLDMDLSITNVLNNDLSEYFENYPKNAEIYTNQKIYAEQIINTAYIAHFGLPSIQFIEEQQGNDQFFYYGGQSLSSTNTPKDFIEYFDSFNEIEDSFLYDLWINRLINAWDYSIFPVNFWSLLSASKSVSQSSTAHECSPQEDAARLINGQLTGTAQILTQIEDNPWWQVDLQELSTIHEIQIFNRIDSDIKMSCCFDILSSVNGQIWQYIVKKTDNSIYGGIDGSPFVWTSEKGILARFIKLIIPGQKKQIGLDQIQIFGQILPK